MRRREALAAGAGAATALLPLAAVAGKSQGLRDANPGFAEIEAALVDNHNRWQRGRSGKTYLRCSDRRMQLLEQAEALPIQSDADAATALMIALRLGDHDPDDYEVWINTGAPEDKPRGNIVLSASRYLAGRAQQSPYDAGA